MNVKSYVDWELILYQEKVTDIIRILPSGIVCFGMHKLNRRWEFSIWILVTQLLIDIFE